MESPRPQVHRRQKWFDSGEEAKGRAGSGTSALGAAEAGARQGESREFRVRVPAVGTCHRSRFSPPPSFFSSPYESSGSRVKRSSLRTVSAGTCFLGQTIVTQIFIQSRGRSKRSRRFWNTDCLWGLFLFFSCPFSSCDWWRGEILAQSVSRVPLPCGSG